MFHWILTILALIISLFGLYAFIKLMTTKQAAIDLMGMREFETLHPELKAFYRKYMIERIYPALIKVANKSYGIARESLTYKKIDEELKNQTDKAVAQINEMGDAMVAQLKDSSDTKEAFQSMVQQWRR